VGQSYVPTDFVVLEIGGDVRAPIILGRPFPSTVKAIIYMDSAKICFIIKDMKKFSFNNHIHHSPSHPQMPYLPEETTVTKKKNNRRRRKNKARQSQEESVKMINLLASHSLPRRKILAYRRSSAQLDKESSTTPSATSDRGST